MKATEPARTAENAVGLAATIEMRVIRKGLEVSKGRLAELVTICGSDIADAVLANHKAHGGNKGPKPGAASEDEVLIRRGGLTMALERLPDGGACITGIPDFARDRATQEWLQAIADEGCPLRLELVMRCAPPAPRRLDSPAALGRLIGQLIRAACRLRAPLAVRIVEGSDLDGHRWRRALDLLLGAAR